MCVRAVRSLVLCCAAFGLLVRALSPFLVWGRVRDPTKIDYIES